MCHLKLPFIRDLKNISNCSLDGSFESEQVINKGHRVSRSEPSLQALQCEMLFDQLKRVILRQQFMKSGFYNLAIPRQLV